MNKKKLFGFTGSLIVAFILSLGVKTYAIDKVKVGDNNIIDGYSKGQILWMNKLSKTFSVDDVIYFKSDDNYKLGKIIKINNDKIAVSRNNEVLEISSSQIEGKTF